MSLSVGDQIQAQVGAWGNNPTSFSYEWQHSANGTTGWADTTDQTGSGSCSDFIIAAGDAGEYLSCLVTGTNLAGDSTQQRSAVVGPVVALLTGIWGFAR